MKGSDAIMEVVIMNKEFSNVAIVDEFQSLIWTERFYECGDFEIYTRPTQKLLSVAQQDYYVWLRDSDQTMIIEDTKIETDIDEGAHLVISGRSLESILDRRIVWEQTILSGNFQNGVKKLLTDNVISPTDSSRKIENFVFETSTDPSITRLEIDAQCGAGGNLYEVITELCSVNRVGFRIYLNDKNQFVFKLIPSIDRSYSQDRNAYVVFSPEFDNLLNSNYSSSRRTLKNVTLVVGEEPENEDEEQKRRIVGQESGLTRREVYTDASSLKTETDDGVELTDDEYNAQLDLQGLLALLDHQTESSFEAEVDTNSMFVYGKDFFIGDVVQFINEFGIGGRARVMEFIRNQDTSGYKEYPTFDVVNEMEG